ncbi:MAG: hypothetical protein EBY52_02650, partial [Actinobacteria bacterium]|nr:hypothetical protein [Actinomycetota bacterium]
MSERPNSDTEPAEAEAEVSRFSLWFLRSVLVVATANASTTPTGLGIDEATDSVEAAASETPA